MPLGDPPPTYTPHPWPEWTVPLIASPPKGCVCPPGSEATCQRSDCGRKDQPSPRPPIGRQDP
jgi:hypothetical protein